MKKAQKLICLILALLMVASLLPMVYAADMPFTDVAAGSWYADYVQYAYSHSLMNGTSDTTFGPDINMSRGMIVTVLHRLEGTPAASAELPFDDVPAKEYYHDAVVWSYENGIVKGISETKFAPNDNVTREQLVTIFYRYADAKDFDTTKQQELSGYTDAAKVSAYAADALRWAVAEGIITGMPDGTLAPDGKATRAQFAAIIQRFNTWTEAQAEETEPTEKPDVTEPTEQPDVTEPTEKPDVTEPTEKPDVTEPTEKPDVTEPSEKPDVTEPTEKPDVTEPTEKPDVTEPTEKPDVTEPTEKPEVTEPTEKPDVTEPTEKPEVTEPTEKPADDPEDTPVTNPSLKSTTISIKENPNTDLFAKDFYAYYVKAGSTEVALNKAKNNFFVFEPSEKGRYLVSTSDANAVITFWGSTSSPGKREPDGGISNNTYYLNVKEDNLGSDYVIGITGADNCILKIDKVGEPILDDNDFPATIYGEGKTVKKFTMPDGVEDSLTAVNISGTTDSITLVLNSEDGYYHVGTANGPILYMNLKYAEPYSMENKLGTSGLACWFYEDGTLVKKEKYETLMSEYIDNCDKSGYYPVTEDLRHMMENSGKYLGWWDKENANSTVWFEEYPALNPELAWMYSCAYGE